MAEVTCPECSTTGLDISLIDSESNTALGYLRRRYDCNACDNRFTTYEVSLTPEIANKLNLKCKERELTWMDLLDRI